LLVLDHKDGFHADPVRRALYRISFGAADGFLFAHPALARPWQAAGLITPQQPIYAVMENSTRMRPLPRELARAQSGMLGHPALLWVGRLNANKDPLTVLDGFERALPQLPDAQLTMAYTAADWLSAVQARIASSTLLRERVQLVGTIAREKLAAFYSAADFFVLGSQHEGTSMALIEALACGAVPVVTDIPTFRAMTAAGALGALWPVGNAVAFADALIRLSQRDLAPMRAAIAAHFARELSWEAIGQRALAAYADAIARRSSRK
jgi:glycosyltransferase involved in cell wall biosynthesis